jgi:D-amino-acid dehydrogenase
MNRDAQSNSDVAVIGGGAIGLCCAYALASRGAQVTLYERNRCGEGASIGNAGWITPALSAPLPAPGVWREVARAFQKDRPLRISPRLDPALLWWLVSFWRHSSASAYEAGARAMLTLGATTPESFSALGERGVHFEMHETGLTFVALSDAQLAKLHKTFEKLAALGYTGEVVSLSSAETRELEPALSSSTAGAFRAVQERHVEPQSLISGLRDACVKSGVRVLEHVEVRQLEVRGHRVGLRLRDCLLQPDAVIVASGVRARPLLARISAKIPIECAKGYSVTVPGAPRVGRALYLSEARIAVTPFRESTRVAGTLELSGPDTSIAPHRIESLEAATRRYLPSWKAGRNQRAWSGLRPLAPDGLPMIGRWSAYDNLYVATGHGMVGITLAPITGEAIAGLIVGETRGVDLAPFAPDRFD